MKKTSWKKVIGLTAITVCMAFGLTACGKELTDEEILANMKEFTAESETVSIYLDQDWTTEDLGIDSWIGAGNSSGSDAAVVVQLPKDAYNGSIASIEDLQDLMEESFQISEEQPVDAPAVPGVSDLTAFTCKMTIDSDSGEGYIIYGESDYAYYMLGYVANTISDAKKRSFDVSCGTLKEMAKEEENNFSTEMTDTIRWFDATYAILTKANNCNVELFGGLAANEENAEAAKIMLEDSWDVTDRASADETMDWILTEGHRTTYKANMKDLEDAGIQSVEAGARKDFILENYQVTEDEAQTMADLYGIYEQYGEYSIDAWDYCRALSLAAFYYHAGYYTEQEALDKSMEIAQMLQPLYTSWDEAMDSYIHGYEYWSEESGDERRGIYEELKAEENSLYNIDWNLTFEKTW